MASGFVSGRKFHEKELLKSMKNSKTKIFALALAAALVMSLTVSASAASFPDMPTGWSKDAMEAAVENGLFEEIGRAHV